MVRPLASLADVRAGRTTVHEIMVGGTRLRVERDNATGEQTYFVDDQPRDVNAYLAVTQAHLNHG